MSSKIRQNRVYTICFHLYKVPKVAKQIYGVKVMIFTFVFASLDGLTWEKFIRW